MKISATDYNGQDVRVSMCAETQAESYQLKELLDALNRAKADAGVWNDMEGQRGIVLVVQKVKA